ncbi:MAG: cell division protein SepF [Candidatus Woesearchaeota archaeon]
MGFFSGLKEKFDETFSTEAAEEGEEATDEYVELADNAVKTAPDKITVRPFIIEDFEDTREILDSLRDGHTIALVNIRNLKDKDIVELKRAINKIKKTCDAIEGDVAGFGDDWICVTPAFASIYRSNKTEVVE